MGVRTSDQAFAALTPGQRKASIARRISLIRGQVGGLERMVEEDRPCPQILTQVTAVREAIRQVGFLVIVSHLHDGLTVAGPGTEPPVSSEELTVLVSLLSDNH